jgi:hypothetical protein
MKIATKTSIIHCVILLAVVLCPILFWARGELIYGTVVRPLEDITECVKAFVQETGRFPESKEDLLKLGYLTLDKSDQEQKRYELRIPNNNKRDDSANWVSTLNFDAFEIDYTFQVDAIKVVDSKLYNKIDG